MNVSGFSFWYPMLMSLTIFAGSEESVAVNMLLGAFDPVLALAITIIINARHLFYSLKDVSIFDGSHGLPELIAIAVIILLHYWKKQMLLSIAGGTICYMYFLDRI